MKGDGEDGSSSMAAVVSSPIDMPMEISVFFVEDGIVSPVIATRVSLGSAQQFSMRQSKKYNYRVVALVGTMRNRGKDHVRVEIPPKKTETFWANSCHSIGWLIMTWSFPFSYPMSSTIGCSILLQK